MGKRYTDEQDAIMEKFAERFPNINTDNMKLQDLIALLQAEGVVGTEGLGLAGLEKSLDMITPESLDRSVQRISRGDTRYGDVPEEIFQGGVGQVGGMQHGGRIGYQGGESVLPEPRPEHDPRAGFFERMGAMPEQTLLRQAQPMRGQVPEGIMGQAPDPYGGLLGGQEGDIGQGGQPLGEYEHEGAEPEPSWWDRAKTGTYDGSLPHTPDINMEMIIDFLKKMGMAITQENIAKAAQALGMAMKFSPMGVGGAAAGLGITGLQSLGAPEEVEETETEQMFQDGGTVRQKYGLGSLVSSIFSAPKKILKSAKKILKSDLGKMAMMYLATAGFANVAAQQGLGGAQKWGGFKWLDPRNVGRNIGSAVSRVIPASWKDATKLKDATQIGSDFVTSGKALPGTGELTGGANILPNAYKLAEMTDWDKAASLAKLGTKELTKAAQPWYKGALPWIGGASVLGGAYTAKYPGEEQFDMAKREGEVDDITEWLAAIKPAAAIDWPYPDYAGAKGGRVGYANGGILDIEEVDLRDNGGFMPLGKKEKADDVPALLSKNEFVFTADAVKSAGEGDPDVGAERMQNVMKNLEAGGKISEESQGLEGAQDMFEVSERLSEVV